MAFERSRRQGRALPALAGVAVTLMLVAGCQGGSDPSASETPGEPTASASESASASATPSASSTPEPSPASSLGPAANIPVPVKPALADENTAEGLEAFTEYWLELFSYGYETNDWEPFQAVTDPGCRTCNATREAVQQTYAEQGWLSGGHFELKSFKTDFEINTGGSIQGFVDYQQADLLYFDADGSATPEEAPEASVNATFSFFRDGIWTILDFGSPEGTE